MKRQSSLLVLLCAAGFVAVSAAGLVLGGPYASPRVAGVASSALAPTERSAQSEQTCRYCGWIESMREIRPAVYEYTVRRTDGSSGVFEDEPSAAWRVGKRLVFIGGVDAVR